MSSRVHDMAVSTGAQNSTTGEQQSVEGCISQPRTTCSNDLSREEEAFISRHDDHAEKSAPEVSDGDTKGSFDKMWKLLKTSLRTISRSSKSKLNAVSSIDQLKLSQRKPHQMNVLMRTLSSGDDSVQFPVQLGETWQQIQGCNNWAGLLDPNHLIYPGLRAEIYRYGRFAKATYDAFDRETGDSKYLMKDLLKEAGLENRGYNITHFLYTTAKVSLPKPFSKVPDANLKKDTNWMGFVAVCTAPREIARLGRRDIVVAWRGTITKVEWIKDTQFWSKSVEFNSRNANKGIPVHSGFLSLYNSSNGESSSVKKSARDQVLEAVKEVVEKYEQEDKQKDTKMSITVTGHSLGSALATLCAYDIAEWISRRQENSSFGSAPGGVGQPETASGESFPTDRIPVTVYSFAGPRVGKQEFKIRIQELRVAVLRVLDRYDVVPKCPCLIFPSYKHVGEILNINDLTCEYSQKNTMATTTRNLDKKIEVKTPETTALRETTTIPHAHHPNGLQALNLPGYHHFPNMLDTMSPRCIKSYKSLEKAYQRKREKLFFRFRQRVKMIAVFLSVFKVTLTTFPHAHLEHAHLDDGVVDNIVDSMVDGVQARAQQPTRVAEAGISEVDGIVENAEIAPVHQL